jgi:dTDP-4-amino-4,6-dideoxygalactose transaminase
VLLTEEPVLGASVERFEREFAASCGVRHAVGVNCGTDAIALALRGLGIGAGDEVATASNTFFATVAAIVACGARPLLVEPDPVTMNLDPARLERALTPRTRAVVPVHLYGRLCDMEAIGALCRARGLLLVEDAAQAHGARAAGRSAGSFGAAGCFSFHPSKNLGAFGDGGAITTDDDALAAKLRELRQLGKRDEYEMHAFAPNTKLDTLQAALLSLKLPGLDAGNRRRRGFAALYRRELAGVGDLLLPESPRGEEHVRTRRRDELRRHLREQGIRASVHYPIPPHLQPLERPLGPAPGELPIAEELSRTVLSLPISPELEEREILEVCRSIRDFFASPA